MRWLNRHALVTLPARIDQSNAAPVSRQLLALVSRDLLVLIVDLSATTDCGHACGQALTRVYQQAMITGTDLRLVADADRVRQMLRMSGLDRVTRTYASVAEAVGATLPAESAPVAVFRAGAGSAGEGPEGVQPGRPRSGSLAGEGTDVEIALLDRDGIIVWVNQAWEAFAAANRVAPVGTVDRSIRLTVDEVPFDAVRVGVVRVGAAPLGGRSANSRTFRWATRRARPSS